MRISRWSLICIYRIIVPHRKSALTMDTWEQKNVYHTPFHVCAPWVSDWVCIIAITIEWNKNNNYFINYECTKIQCLNTNFTVCAVTHRLLLCPFWLKHCSNVDGVCGKLVVCTYRSRSSTSTYPNYSSSSSWAKLKLYECTSKQRRSKRSGTQQKHK